MGWLYRPSQALTFGWAPFLFVLPCRCGPDWRRWTSALIHVIIVPVSYRDPLTTSMKPPACIMMQRDEDDLLAPWLPYHGYMFGFENLYVLDNGSTHSVTLDTIRRYQTVGVNFDFSFSRPADYEQKGGITRDKINELSKSGRHDIFLPLDCDEFVVSLGTRGLSCSRNEVSALLEPFVAKRGVMVVPTLLYNVPGNPAAFYFQDQQKVFFSGGGVGHLDHGNHHGGMPGADAPRRAKELSYLHFHNRSFVSLQVRALEKLKNRVDIANPDKLLAYKGHGDHLVRYFTMTERDYIEGFASRDVVMFPEFMALLEVLAVKDGLRRATYSSVSVEPTGSIFSAAFDGAAYWAANPDVEELGTPGLLHYYRHGRRERRRLTVDPKQEEGS